MPRRNIRLNMRGFDELRANFDQLPPELRADAEPIISQHADRAADLVRQSYPEITGNLRRGVRVFREAVAAGLRIVTRVVSSAPHAHLYEFGTFRSRAFPTFLPITERARKEMVRDVADMVRAKGLTVTGDRDAA